MNCWDGSDLLKEFDKAVLNQAYLLVAEQIVQLNEDEQSILAKMFPKGLTNANLDELRTAYRLTKNAVRNKST